jgi:hypothetical protein
MTSIHPSSGFLLDDSDLVAPSKEVISTTLFVFHACRSSVSSHMHDASPEDSFRLKY